MEKFAGADYKNKPIRYGNTLTVCGHTLGVVQPPQEKEHPFLKGRTLVLVEAEFEEWDGMS